MQSVPNKATRLLLLSQIAVTILAGLAALFSTGGKAAISAAVGGGISILVTAVVAKRVFAGGAGVSAKQVLRGLIVGEAIKIGLTVFLFSIVIVWMDVMFLPLFLTYAATLLAYWLVLPFTADILVKNS